MELYRGIDLPSTNSYTVVLDGDDRVVFQPVQVGGWQVDAASVRVGILRLEPVCSRTDYATVDDAMEQTVV